MNEPPLGIIGGSGLYDIEELDNFRKLRVETPFGDPSSEIVMGEIKGRTVAFISRHGVGHVLSPSRVNYQANIFALKSLGVEKVLAFTAVGSLREEIRPLDIALPDQLYDKTRLRESTFFSDFVVHVGFAEPTCPHVSRIIGEYLNSKGWRYHSKGTYVCIEGPQFSSRIESAVHRAMNFDIIGMTALPEAKLAREAELCYSIVAMVTDYDVWKVEDEEDVSVSKVVEYIRKNRERVKEMLLEVVPMLPLERDCRCGDALQGAIITSRDLITEDTVKKYGVLVEKYL